MSDGGGRVERGGEEKKGSIGSGRRWRWALVPVVFGLIGYGLLPLQSWDYWWHLVMGRLFEATGEVPREALFLYTMPADAASYVQPWLAQWLLYLVHETFGLRANLLLRGVIVAGTFGAVTWWGIGRSGDTVAAGLLGVAGLVVAFPFLDVRTNLFALPLFVGTLAIVRAVYQRRVWKHAIWGVVPIVVLWANLHGSFLLPAVVCGIHAVAEALARARMPLLQEEDTEARARMPLLQGGAAVAALVAPMVNPRGWELYGYVYRVASDPVVQQTVTEWQMTTPTFPRLGGPVFYLLLVAAGLLFWVRRANLEPADVVLTLAFGALAISQARGLIWFGLLVPVTLAPYLEADRGGEGWPRAGWAAVGLASLLAVALQPCWPWWSSLVTNYEAVPVRQTTPYRGAVPAETPVAAMQKLREENPAPRLFHDERWAGFFLYHLLGSEPRRLVYVDQRVELPPVETWRSYAEVSRGERWETIFGMYRVEAAVVHRQRQSGLVEALAGSRGWQRVAGEGAAVLFVKRRGSVARWIAGDGG